MVFDGTEVWLMVVVTSTTSTTSAMVAVTTKWRCRWRRYQERPAAFASPSKTSGRRQIAVGCGTQYSARRYLGGGCVEGRAAAEDHEAGTGAYNASLTSVAYPTLPSPPPVDHRHRRCRRCRLCNSILRHPTPRKNCAPSSTTIATAAASKP